MKKIMIFLAYLTATAVIDRPIDKAYEGKPYINETSFSEEWYYAITK